MKNPGVNNYCTVFLVEASTIISEVQDEPFLQCTDAARPSQREHALYANAIFFPSFFSKVSSERAASASVAINHSGSGAEGKAHLVHAVPTPGLNKP